MISNKRTAFGSILGIAACLVWAGVGCSEGASEQSPESIAKSEEAIIGGEPAGDEYDAVGAIVAYAADGTVQPFCSGTLVGPDTVVTAKHCLVSTPSVYRIGFALGAEAAHPHTLIPEAAEHSRDWENDVTAPGAMGLGSDVAVLHLARPVWSVKPLKIGQLAASDVGKTFEQVGYGLEQSREEPGPFVFGNRKKATTQLKAIAGRTLELQYGTLENAFAAAAATVPPEVASDPSFAAAVAARWDQSALLPGYEAWVGSEQAPFVCSGDSGGPLLGRDAKGKLVVYGVESGSVAFDGSCRHPSVVATFGPEAADLVATSGACREQANGGYCGRVSGLSYSVACKAGKHEPSIDVCNRKTESCADTPRGATCAPKCTTDADCTKLAPSGTCHAATGTCEWTRQCTSEATYFACTLCCGAVFGPPDPSNPASAQANACAASCAAGTDDVGGRLPALKTRFIGGTFPRR